jgi:hypothetical protein
MLPAIMAPGRAVELISNSPKPRGGFDEEFHEREIVELSGEGPTT